MQQAKYQAEGGAFAGSVGPNHAEYGAFRNLEADAVGRYPSALEYLGQVGGLYCVDLTLVTVGVNSLLLKHFVPLPPAQAAPQNSELILLLGNEPAPGNIKSYCRLNITTEQDASNISFDV